MSKLYIKVKYSYTDYLDLEMEGLDEEIAKKVTAKLLQVVLAEGTIAGQLKDEHDPNFVRYQDEPGYDDYAEQGE